MDSEARGHRFGDCRVLCVIWEFHKSLQFEEKSFRETKSYPAVEAWAWPPIRKEPEASPAESGMRITPECKEPPAAREQGPRDQCKNPGR